MKEEPTARGEQNSVQEHKSAWEEAIVQIVKDRFRRVGRSLPNISARSLKTQAPYLLEESSERHLVENRGRNQFVILTSPSGCGKGTIGQALEKKGFERLPRILTRAPRPGETPGQDFIFISNADFERMLERGEIVLNSSRTTQSGKTEHWGISLPELLKWVRAGRRFYFEGSTRRWQEFNEHPKIVELQFMPVFILTPSFEAYYQRFLNRQEEEKARGSQAPLRDVNQRISEAIALLKRQVSIEPDYIWLVNDQVGRVADKIVENY